MQAAAKGNLVFRNDTVLGVCEAIGQDFGFHPNWLRLLFASLFYLYPVEVIAGYLALGSIVLASRLLFPDRNAAAATEQPSRPAAIDEQPELPLAA